MLRTGFLVTDKTLLILEDDAPLRNRLCRAMEKRGFDVVDAGSVNDGIDLVRKVAPAFAILDMKLDDGTGLSLVPELRKKRSDCRIIMLAGFGNIATAVAAVKAGAVDYLGLFSRPHVSMLCGAHHLLSGPMGCQGARVSR